MERHDQQRRARPPRPSRKLVRLARFARRHVWSLASLAGALFLWAAGALATPAPAALAAVLATVVVLGLLAPKRALGPWPAAIYCASFALGTHFLLGVFLPQTTAVVAPRAARDDGEGGRLRVLSLNVEHGYPWSLSAHEDRYRRLRRLLEDADPDLVLLQESWRTRANGDLVQRLGEELEYAAAYSRVNGSLRFLGFEEGLGILSRFPLADVERRQLGPRWPPWEMRGALVASLDVPGAEPLTIVNTHLSHRAEDIRTRQARSLATALSDSEVGLLAGDLNATADSGAVGAFASLELRPLLSDAIDHVLASPALLDTWVPTTTEILRVDEDRGPWGNSLPLSDHPALLVELEQRAGVGRSAR